MQFGKILICLLLLIFIGLIVIDYFNHTYIKAEFSRTDPMPPKMGVYYKGYRLGSTHKLKISKDFKTTYLYIKLNQRGLHLPKNIKVKVKNYDEDVKYVDIIYPAAPSIKYIRSGDIIKGEYNLTTDGISETNQAHLDSLSAKGEDFLSSAAKTTDALTDMLELITDILGENRENILSSTTSLKNSLTNFETTSENLKEMSQKINNGIDQNSIKNSTSNIEVLTANLADSTREFVSISGNFNKTSSDFNVLIPKISTLIDVVQMVMCNLNEIIIGLKKTLKQRFGGARLIFGKAIKE